MGGVRRTGRERAGEREHETFSSKVRQRAALHARGGERASIIARARGKVCIVYCVYCVVVPVRTRRAAQRTSVYRRDRATCVIVLHVR